MGVLFRRMANSLTTGPRDASQRRVQGPGGPDPSGDPAAAAGGGDDGGRAGRAVRHEQAFGVAPLLGPQAGRPDRLAAGRPADLLLPEHDRDGGPDVRRLGPVRVGQWAESRGAQMRPWLVVIVALAVLTGGGSAAVWLNRADWLPERVPMHWGLHG